MNLKNKKILVTGGAGFIGSHTVDALIRKGANIVIVDNLLTGRKENINPKAKFYEMNIANPDIEDIFKKEKPEIIYHFAFNVQVPKSVENPLVDMDSIIGSVNLLRNICKYGAEKIIFSSSCFVYGNTKNLPTKETEPINPISSYIIAKNTVENYLRFFNTAYGLPYVIFRYGTVYGERQVMGAMADYIRQLAKGNQAKIWGNGSKTRDYVYVKDVVQANLLVLELPNNYSNPVFNISSGVETTLNDLYWKIAKLLKKKPQPEYLPDRSGELRRFCLDSSKIKEVLGWRAEYNLNQGLKLKLKSEGLI
ncbi:NAD-dependent epimerase/dehydratase family protein [Candidatus Parcubacteria bacterium]|nr:NAD-dependent epimerase/dehydratase family protein [Candidatus Parcubacteria bacterium]